MNTELAKDDDDNVDTVNGCSKEGNEERHGEE
jgi:hypothetical protein